jgi:pyruvate,water dikinase
MVAGWTCFAFRPDDELRRLAQLAIDLRVDEVLTRGDAHGSVFSALDGSENARTWLKAYDGAKEPWFNYFAEYGFTHDQETWLSNRRSRLSGIARYATKLRAGEDISRPSSGSAGARRDRGRVPQPLTEEEAAQFDELLGLGAHGVPPYIESTTSTSSTGPTRSSGRRRGSSPTSCSPPGSPSSGTTSSTSTASRSTRCSSTSSSPWAIGVPARGKRRWAEEIARRRGIWARAAAEPPEPAYGPAPEQFTDPFAIMNYGVTTERIQAWLGRGGTASDSLTGIPGSPE